MLRACLGKWPTLWGPMALALIVSTARAGQGDGPASRYVAAEDLVAYVQFDGLDSHGDAWEATAMRSILEDTTTGAMLRTLAGQLLDGSTAAAPGMPVSGDQITAITEHLTSRGFVLAVHGPLGEDPPAVTLVLPGAGEGPAAPAFQALLRAAVPRDVAPQTLTRQDGRKLSVVRPDGGAEGGWAYWTEGKDLILVAGRGEFGAEPVFAAMAGETPSLADSETLAALSEPADGFEPVAIGWFDADTLPPAPPSLGLDGLERIDFRVGFDGEALVTLTRLAAPGPREGILTLFDQPPLTADSFPPIPKGTEEYTVFSADLGATYDLVVKLVKDLEPQAEAQIKAVDDSFRQMTGVSLRDELLAELGPKFAFYVETKTIRATISPYTMLLDWFLNFPPAIATIEVKDADAFAETLDRLMEAVNGALVQAGTAGGAPARFETLEAPARGYRLIVPPQLFPLPPTVQPAVVLGDHYLAISTQVDAAKRALAASETEAPPMLPPGTIAYSVSDPRDRLPQLLVNLPFFAHLIGRMGPQGFQPGAVDPRNPFAKVAIGPELIPSADAIREHLFPGTAIITVDDAGLTIRTRDAFPTINPVSAGPVAVALLLPAVQAARSSARRAQSTNNMKQMALAMWTYHENNGGLPPQAITDEDGKPLLSWRVAILPYIEQQALYNQFHLDEPWDSPHNKELLSVKVPVYLIPGSEAPEGETYYQAFVGDGALVDPTEMTKIQEITDGTSNTIMIVEAGESVPWTKPEDLEYSEDEDLPPLGGHFPGGFNAAFADGSVRFLKHTIAEEVLRALITRAGGEVISADSF